MKILKLTICVMCLNLVLCACSTKDNILFSRRELLSSEIYVHQFMNMYNANTSDNNSFEVKSEQINRAIADILMNVEKEEVFIQDGRINLERGEPFLFIKNSDNEYVVYFYDVYDFISIHSGKRYEPSLWIQEMTRKGNELHMDVWECSISAQNYAEILNLMYNAESESDIVAIDVGLEGIKCNLLDLTEVVQDTEAKSELQEIGDTLLERKDLEECQIYLYKDAYLYIMGMDTKEECVLSSNSEVHSQIVNIICGAKKFRDSVLLPNVISSGGKGEPGITLVTNDVSYIVSFIDTTKQIAEDSLYPDELVISIRKEQVINNKCVCLGEGLYILPSDAYKKIYEMAAAS